MFDWNSRSKRNSGINRRASTGDRLNFHLATNQGKSFSHTCKTEPSESAFSVQCNGIKTAPIVVNCYSQSPFCVFNDNTDLGGLSGVLCHVRQRFLNDAIDSGPRLVRQIIKWDGAAMEIGFNPESYTPFQQIVAQCACQPYFVDREGPQLPR